KTIKKKPAIYWWYGILLFAFMGTFFIACNNSTNLTLGTLPKADFTLTHVEDANTIILVNKTNMPSIAYWSTSNGQSAKGDSAKIHFIFKGTYTVKLLVSGHGGLDSTTKE